MPRREHVVFAVLPALGFLVVSSTGLLAGACAAPLPGEQSPRRIAITVDDLPVAPPRRHTTEQQARITEGLLAVLAAHEAPAIGFVNESKLEVDGEVESQRVEFLKRWLEAGHELGNHGYAHLDLHRVPPETWMADVIRGERITRPLVEVRDRRLRWFRHPFLHTGRSMAVQHRTTHFLAEHGYEVAPVTLDNSEWIYADAYADAWNRGDEAVMERLGEDYVRYMLDVVEYYEAQSLAIVGELVPQTLLVHAYALNADWLGPLLDALEARGYGWITLEEAVEHPAYDRPIHGYTGPGGITWLHRWAITDKRDPELFRGEPEVPDWVRSLADGQDAPAAGAAEPPAALPLAVDRAEVRHLTSRVNEVAYELRVSLPHGYARSERRFPVVYTLDADYSFLIARNVTDHLAEREHLDEVIVVGVGYRNQERGRSGDYRLNRTRDYTPTFVPDGGYGSEVQKVSGGGPRFLEVLATEIMPFVDASYRTIRSDRTLVGHSYGGLFAVWTLFTRPGLFHRFVAVSPSLWYDEKLALHIEESFANEHDALPARVYLCAGSRENRVMAEDLMELVGRLERRGYEGLSFQSLVMENETHNSIFPGCLSNGLRYVFEGR